MEQTKHQPKISVIVPVYNNEKFVVTCMKSLLAQTLEDLEIICINDGSTDNSSAVLHGFADQDPRVIVIDKENGGYGVGINRGLDEATGEYVTILESDDFADLDMYETLYSYASTFDLDVCRANFYLYWQSKIKHDFPLLLFGEHECDRVIDPSIREDQHCFYAQPALWSAIYRRSFIEENKLRLTETPGAAYQDTAFNFKIWACAKRVMFVHKPFIHYRQDNEASSINDKSKVFNICIEYDELDRWLDEDRPDLRPSLAPVMRKMMCDAFTWNASRVGEDHKVEFVKRFGEYFAKAEAAGEIDPALFPPGNLALVRKTAENPQEFLDYAFDGVDPDRGLKRITRKIGTFAQVFRDDGVKGIIRETSLKVLPPEEASLVDRMDAEYSQRKKPVFLGADCQVEPQVSVIMTAYNLEAVIGETLDSVFAQTFKDFELVVVDDGSTDGTPGILADYAAKDGRMRIITQENQGVATARNNGMAEVRAPYFMLLDGDDIFDPEMLASLVKKAEATQADITLCRSYEYDGERYERRPQEWALKMDMVPKGESFTVDDASGVLFEAFMGWPWDRLYRTDFVKAANLAFPTTLANSEDGVWVYGILARAAKLAVVNRVLIGYRVGRKGSVSNSRLQHPECFYDATVMIKKDLKEQGLYGKLEKSFLNWAVDYALWNISSLPKGPVRKNLASKLMEGGYPELEIFEHGLEYFDLYPDMKKRFRDLKKL